MLDCTPTAASRRHLPDVTLCAVDTRTPHLARSALRACMQGLSFAQVLLLSEAADDGRGEPEAGCELGDGIEHRPIERLSGAAAYSEFVLRELPQHVRTEFVLLVQWDGFIEHPACWRDDFLAVDYLGAPWGKGPIDRRVGNGGFSLRSQRLMRAMQGLPAHHPEDVCLAITHRERLESEHGVRFGPLPLAQAFAQENEAVAHPTFGFHGMRHLPRVLGPTRTLQWLSELPDAALAGRDGLKTLRALLDEGAKPEARALLGRRLRAQHTHSGHRWSDFKTLWFALKLALS